MSEEAEKEAIVNVVCIDGATGPSSCRIQCDQDLSRSHGQSPWQQITEDNLDIPHAREVLDEDHYGLDEIKERILEFLAVRKLRSERKAVGREGVLCVSKNPR